MLVKISRNIIPELVVLEMISSDFRKVWYISLFSGFLCLSFVAVTLLTEASWLWNTHSSLIFYIGYAAPYAINFVVQFRYGHFALVIANRYASVNSYLESMFNIRKNVMNGKF